MMPAKIWCDHAEDFESGLRAWELDVGDWERASGTALADAVKYTVMMNMAPIFLRNNFQLGTCCQQHSSSRSPVTVVLNFGANPRVGCKMERAQIMTACKSTLSRKARGRAKANTETRKEIARTTHAARAMQTSTRARTVAELDIGRKTAGDQVEEPTTIPPVTRTRRQAKANHLKQLQPCHNLHKHRVQMEISRAIQTWNRGSWV